MIKTDILIIGAGPTGLFAVFEAGLLKLKCHLIDALPQPGGQCSELYPKKPIYDIPGYPEILAGDLTKQLLKQCEQFQPGFTLGERADTIEKLDDNSFVVTTNKGTKHHAPVVAIAGGLGSFEPRKPLINNIGSFEDNGVAYMIKDPEVYRDKRVVISGGGDSALDWSIFLADIASQVTLIHRRNEFRGALDSVEKVQELKNQNKINLITPAEVTGLVGDEKLTGKKIGKDFDEGKFTLPLIIALPLMTSKKQSLVLETLFERNETDFNEIIKMIKETGAIEKVEKICNKFSETCFKELNNFPESDYKTGLIDIVENINTRVS